MFDKIYSTGRNNAGQLGIGHNKDVRTFTEVTGDWGKIIAVKSGGLHTFIRSEHDKWYAAGRNDYGQLGLGHTNKVYAFTEVKDTGGWGKIVEVECGFYHTFMRTECGKWYATGHNDNRQLGLGHNTNNVCVFEEIAGGWGKIVAVVCGGDHTFMRTECGKWYATGCNDYGQLGLGHTNNVSTFTEVAGVWGKIVAVVCGGLHTFMRSEHGKVYAAGYNPFGQLGLGHTNNVYAFEEVKDTGVWGKIVAVVCGWHHTFMQTECEKWYAVGRNDLGQLGLGHEDNVSTFTEVADTGGWGKIVEVKCGGCHTFMRSEHGKWYAVGHNRFGQLGFGGGEICSDGTVPQTHFSAAVPSSFYEPSYGGCVQDIIAEREAYFYVSIARAKLATRGEAAPNDPRRMYNFREVTLSKVGIPTKMVCGAHHTFLIVRTTICRKCGCCFTPTKLYDDLLFVKRYLDNLGIMDDIRKVIFIFCARLSAEQNCSKEGFCYSYVKD